MFGVHPVARSAWPSYGQQGIRPPRTRHPAYGSNELRRSNPGRHDVHRPDSRVQGRPAVGPPCRTVPRTNPTHARRRRARSTNTTISIPA
ncbi:hypothetical protein GY45DRAFT_1332172 [Cubamyces sp. BRFM 1775]|nr:hypothetical protein GY45DRAFT_1332172 [Cubamyces sp. BRFM 1775]